MKNEFKIRDKYNKEWLRKDNLFITQEGTLVHIDCFENLYTYSKYDFKIVQWTGLTDKNNTKMFEQDIIKYENKIYYLYYKTNVASFVLSNEDECINFNVFETENMEVVGNKFQNPKLYNNIY